MTTTPASTPRRRRTALALLTAKAVLGASLALGLTLSPHTTAHVYAAPQCSYSVTQSDGTCLEEDEPGWDCATMGNRVCGPTTHYRLGTGPLADWGDDNGYDAGYEN